MSDYISIISKHEPLDDGLVVYLVGDIEFTGAPHLRTEIFALLDTHQPKRLVIDLSGVPYMDSSGIATIVETLQHQRQKSHQLVLCSLQDKVHSMFVIASLDTLFTIVGDLNAAKQASPQ